MKSIKTQWLKDKRKGSAFVVEDVRANPDSLRDDEAIYANSQPTDAQYLMGQAVEHLQGRQRAVYLDTMRLGMSLQQSALKQGIAKGTAQVYKARAIAFIEGYCRQALGAR